MRSMARTVQPMILQAERRGARRIGSRAHVRGWAGTVWPDHANHVRAARTAS